MKREVGDRQAEVSKAFSMISRAMLPLCLWRQMSEVNGVKGMQLILERYYMRNGSMAVSQSTDHRLRRGQQATIIGTGGDEGLMNISLGANQDFARRVAKVLAKLGFLKSDLDFEEGQNNDTFMS